MLFRSVIAETYYEEIYSEDGGIVLWEATYERPIFSGEFSDVLNAVYDAEEKEFKIQQIKNAEIMNTDYEEGYLNPDYPAGSGEAFVSNVYIKKPIISVVRLEYLYMGGAHGSSYYLIDNFDMNSGAGLGIENFLKFNPHTEIMELYYQQNPNPFDDEWTDDDKAEAAEILTLNYAEAYLAEDGVHILWNDQYMFYYAYGIPEVIVPYDRWDILASLVTDAVK